MRQVAKKGLLTAVATGGVLAMTGGLAYADSDAQGTATGSPGVLSGNTVQVPVHIPVNACGNTVNVVGLFNSASDNTCANEGGSTHSGGSSADGAAKGSDGIASGNVIQAPIDVPVNACGNSVSVIGAGNATDDACVNDAGPGRAHPGHGPKDPQHPQHPSKPHQPPHGEQPGKPHHPTKPSTSGKPGTSVKPGWHAPAGTPGSELADTGSENVGLTLMTSAGLLLGGAVLFRRSRSARS